MDNAEYRDKRISLGYTQDQLAAIVGVSRKTIWERESTSGNSPIRTEARLAILSIKPKNKTKCKSSH